MKNRLFACCPWSIEPEVVPHCMGTHGLQEKANEPAVTTKHPMNVSSGSIGTTKRTAEISVNNISCPHFYFWHEFKYLLGVLGC